MKQYHNAVSNVLMNGAYKANRTGVDTISGFSEHYKIDVGKGYPLLTTKKMDGFRWNSMIHELFWYLSGEEHVRNLTDKTSIWDAWADESGNLDTAYGRFWRRYPVPEVHNHLNGESWLTDTDHDWVTDESDTDDGKQRLTFDQIQYVIDQLNENPQSRRIVVQAWHPANASISTLPPCHFTFVFNVQGDGTLNLHLTQRSADLALGVPFNIACYALILKVIAQETGFDVGTFSHTLVDAHVYCGSGDRGEWYEENIDELQARLANVDSKAEYRDVKQWIESNAPPEADGDENKDHVPGLLEQLTRKARGRSTIEIADKPLDELTAEDIVLDDYNSHPGLTFGVAE